MGWLINAFSELSTERQIGMDIGPIPKSKIDDYAARHELGSLFVQQILELDRRYLEGHAKSLKKVAR